MKDACTEAAGDTSAATDSEVGVFCGKYKTEVPEGYFEYLINRLQEGKKRKNAVTLEPEDEARARKTVVAGSRRQAEEPRTSGGRGVCVVHLHRIDTRQLTVL